MASPETNETSLASDQMFIAFLHEKGLDVVPVIGDGNCLFRAVADQLFGEENEHHRLRQECFDYMEEERGFFSQYIDGDFNTYIQHKRQDGVYGDHLELQALTELYSCPIDIYVTGTREILSLEQSTVNETKNTPLRLSYHNGNHYNSIRDIHNPWIGVRSGTSKFKPGWADKMQLQKAILENEYIKTDEELVKQVQLESEQDDLDHQMLTHIIMDQSSLESIQADLEEAVIQQSLRLYLDHPNAVGNG